MLKLCMHDFGGRIKLLLVLEPANLELLKSGQGISINVLEVAKDMGIDALAINTVDLCYTPDCVWVATELNRRQITRGEDFSALLQESWARPEVKERPLHPPIAMTYEPKADA